MKTENTFLNKRLRVVRPGGSRFLCLITVAALFLRLSAFASGTVTLTWNPSGDPSVTGYRLYYGGISGVYTNLIVVGNATNITVSGLGGGLTYYFVASATTATGWESPFSNEVAYQVPPWAILYLRVNYTNGVPVSISISAGGTIPDQWTLLASTNLKTWATVARGTNLGVHVLLPFNHLPMQFFRLLGQ
jgi:hypothetical protein